MGASGASPADLVYDPLGRLFQVSRGGSGIRRLVYDGDALVAEYDSGGGMPHRYIHGNDPGADDPLVWYHNSAYGWQQILLTDHQGSVIGVTDMYGHPFATNSYDPWGIPAATNAGRFGYTGQTWVPELGLWYYKARFHSPTIGRYLVADAGGCRARMNRTRSTGSRDGVPVEDSALQVGAPPAISGSSRGTWVLDTIASAEGARPAPAAPERAIDRLIAAHSTSAIRYLPEEAPFTTVFVDLTHRCNMECRNCYIPVRELPDLPAEWLYAQLAKLPRRTRIRLVGAEPTVREDLPEIIARVRSLGHIPVVLSNGLKLGRRSYVATLKQAGLRTVHLSLNGGLRDEYYEALDGMPCAARKLKALDNLVAERMNVTAGMILVPGLNDGHVPEFIDYLLQRGIIDIHFRSVGPTGRHMEDTPFDLDGLEQCLRRAWPAAAEPLEQTAGTGSSRDFRSGAVRVQLTAWPDLGSRERGRLTPEGFVEPFFESIIANEFHY